MTVKKKLRFDDLAKDTAMFNKTVREEEKVREEKKESLEDNEPLEKGKNRNVFEIIEARNKIVSDKTNNLINVSDKAKEVVEYVCTALSVGKKEFVDALIFDYYLTHKEEIKKEAQRKIKNGEINI